jgi:hypothetical protein
MKKFITPFGAILLLVLLAAIVVVWQHARREKQQFASTKASFGADPVQQVTPAPAPVGAPKQVPGGPYEPDDPRWQWWNKERKADPKFEWKMPIRFYGKVVDENSYPVTSAEVRLQWNDTSAAGTSYRTAITDSVGLFSLDGVSGKLLQVRVRKDGYESLPTRTSFEYAAFFDKNYYEPDSSRPVLFRLRKKRDAEPLIVHQTLYKVSVDGAPNYIDLISGDKQVGVTPSGDIAIRILRTEAERSRFNWTVEFKGVGDAGLIESQDESMVSAPEAGYQSQIEYIFDANDSGWSSEAKRKFYVHSPHSNMFARIEAHLIANYNNDAAIDLRVYANPNGSRNLEFDPTKQTKAK